MIEQHTFSKWAIIQEDKLAGIEEIAPIPAEEAGFDRIPRASGPKAFIKDWPRSNKLVACGCFSEKCVKMADSRFVMLIFPVV